MKHFIYILIISLGIISCTPGNPSSVEEMVLRASKEVELISPEKAMEIMQGESPFNLIDVRQKDEHYHGFIQGSVNLSRGSIEFNIGKKEFWEKEGLYTPNLDETLILYCKKGNRSLLAAQTLKMLGYKKVMVIEGGFKNWELTYPDFCDKNLEMLNGGGDTHNQGGGC